MLSQKTVSAEQDLKLDNQRTKWVDKLRHLEARSAEDIVQFLSDSLFKLLIFFGVPYFIWVLIQFILTTK